MSDYITVNKNITKKNLNDIKGDIYWYDSIMNRYSEEFTFIEKYLKEGDWFLDIGIRDGSWMELIINEGYNIIGTDISDETIKICEEKGLDVVNVDAHNMKEEFNDEYFNVVTIIHALEHCPYPEKVLDEIYRVLLPGGIVFIEVPIHKYEDSKLWGHFHCFEHENEVDLMVSKKFKILETDKMNPPSKRPWYRLIGRKENV